MIFYFSGTGNSRLVAKQMADALNDRLVSINRHLKEGGPSEFASDKPLVFVAPTYAWRLPRVVEQWVRSVRFEGNRDAYFVLTCGGNCGNAAAYLRGLCKDAGLAFRGLAPVLMPENYVALYPTPSASECREITERAHPQVASLSAQVQAGESFPGLAITAKDRLLSGPVNVLFYPLMVHDAKFRVSDACVSCGACAERCSLNDISMVAGKPVWGGTCTHCMACIAGCPAHAIEYGPNSRERHHHYLQES